LLPSRACWLPDQYILCCPHATGSGTFSCVYTHIAGKAQPWLWPAGTKGCCACACIWTSPHGHMARLPLPCLQVVAVSGIVLGWVAVNFLSAQSKATAGGWHLVSFHPPLQHIHPTTQPRILLVYFVFRNYVPEYKVNQQSSQPCNQPHTTPLPACRQQHVRLQP
jgi:hypothetical protein